MTIPRIILRPRKAQPLFGRHPWVYAGTVAAVSGDPADGAEVEVFSHAGSFIARGIFNSQSSIRVRLYCWESDRPLDADFFRQRLQAAIRLRRDTLKWTGPDRACRLVFSEGDGLSGLTVDQYGRWLVVQFTSLGLGQRRELFADLLTELLQPEGIFLRTERGIGKLEGLEARDEPLRGPAPPSPVTIEEDGLRFLVNVAEGQKTGFYLDQRENRRAVAAFASGKRVLDAFCYTGGFGLYAARAGASAVECVDVSEVALALARANADANGLTGLTFVRADVFDHLNELAQQGRRFDLIVLDPPKFARARHAIPEAMRGYRQLQRLALRLLDPDGLLVTCCCTGLITREMLEELLGQLAAEERRDVQILDRRGQAADHPVSASCLETSYLKCLISRVV